MLEKFHVAQKDIVHVEEKRLRSVTKEILMTQGIPEKDAYQMLINGFLCEILEKLSEGKIKNFLKEKLERQINGY